MTRQPSGPSDAAAGPRRTPARRGPLPVALDASPLRPGQTGVGRYVEQLLAHTPADDVRWTLLTSRADALPGALTERRRGLSFRPTLVWLQTAVPHTLWHNDVALAHFTTGRAPLLCPVPFVLTVHDLTVLEQPALYRARERWLVAPWLRAAVRRAAAVIAVSDDTAAALRRCFPALRAPVHVIPEAAAPEFHAPVTPDARAAVRARYDLPPRYWLHVGAASRRKNLARLVAAVVAARSQVGRPTPALVRAGANARDPDRTGDLTRLARQLGAPDAVRALGYVDAADLPALYAAAELLALPSRHEGFGLPALEAMAVGTPVLAGDRGALPEVTGGAAWLVDPTDADSIADGLTRLGSDIELRAALRSRGRARSADFSWQRTAAETVRVYRTAINETAPL